jgi:hypothetical protein
MSTAKHSKTFYFEKPIDVLFPMFSVEAEKSWIPNWDYKNILGHTNLHEDYVFLSKNSDSTKDVIWLVKRYIPVTHLIQFYKVEPEDKIGIITVQCNKIEANLTQVEISYEYISLSKKGDDFITSFTSEKYNEFINQLINLLVKYFHTSEGN